MAPTTIIAQQQQQTGDGHLTAIAALMFAWAGLVLLFGIVVLAATLFGGAVGQSQSGEDDVFAIAAGAGILTFFILLVAALPALLAGIGIMKRQEWGRILGIVVAVLALFNIPFGTAFGIYALVILTQRNFSQSQQQTVVYQ